jgi:SAM-dependent methyltransferase
VEWVVEYDGNCKIISPDDVMFYPEHPEHYFNVGKSALDIIIKYLTLYNKKPDHIHHILDMPCGHGRVLRMLKCHFPKSKISCCDIDKNAVNFCSETFGALPVYSSNNIDDIKLDAKFDLIWCGSLLTHLDKSHWPKFLQFFNDHLKNDGLLIFTTHGNKVFEFMKQGNTYGIEENKLKKLQDDYQTNQFGYANYENEEYGISISSTAFVSSIISKIPKLSVLGFTEKGWDNHQDVFCCLKIP